MTISDKLREYNKWRRGADMPQPDPAELGKLIDDAADQLEELEKELVGKKSAHGSGEYRTTKSEKQRQLEKQGCIFRGQELLDNSAISGKIKLVTI